MWIIPRLSLVSHFFLVVQGYEGRVPSIFEFYFSFFIKRKHLLSIALTFFISKIKFNEETYGKIILIFMTNFEIVKMSRCHHEYQCYILVSMQNLKFEFWKRFSMIYCLKGKCNFCPFCQPCQRPCENWSNIRFWMIYFVINMWFLLFNYSLAI